MRTGARAWLLLALLAACGLAPPPDPVAEQVRAGPWLATTLGDGVELRCARFAGLFAAAQSVRVLVVDPHVDGVRIEVAVPDHRTRTSEVGQRSGALAAVNGGFFEPDGHPRGLRRGGAALLSLPPGKPQAAVGFGAHGETAFGDATADDWGAYPAVVGAGPMLLRDGAVIDHGPAQRTTRHPRTAVGRDGAGRIHFVVVDGRVPEAAGMSYEELARTMAALGCIEAINLDGGGSSTLWVKGQPDGGIVNHPCDDKVYDAAGERAVSDAVLIFARGR